MPEGRYSIVFCVSAYNSFETLYLPEFVILPTPTNSLERPNSFPIGKALNCRIFLLKFCHPHHIHHHHHHHHHQHHTLFSVENGGCKGEKSCLHCMYTIDSTENFLSNLNQFILIKGVSKNRKIIVRVSKQCLRRFVVIKKRLEYSWHSGLELHLFCEQISVYKSFCLGPCTFSMQK